MEVQEDGQFLGYLPIDGTYDAPSNTMVYELPLSALSGTLFLPVMMQPAWVTTFDPGVHMWSSAFKTAVDFGAGRSTVHEPAGRVAASGRAHFCVQPHDE